MDWLDFLAVQGTLKSVFQESSPMVFPVVMYGCESWTIQKAEFRRMVAFELVLEKTLESPLMQGDPTSPS